MIFSQKILIIGDFEKHYFFESAILIFFSKNFFFAFFIIKTSQSLLVSKDRSILIKPYVTMIFYPCQTF